jgi:hypothetical protein
MTFEEWWKTRVVVGNDNDKDTCRQVWEAATAAERERCAAIADKHARRNYWKDKCNEARMERDILRSQTLDLALLVGRLIRRMRAARTGEGIAAGDEALEQQCIGYLRRKGLTSPLRDGA